MSERDIELWYLGRPFDAPGDNGSGKGGKTKPARVVPFPLLTEDDVERLYMGLPFKAA